MNGASTPSRLEALTFAALVAVLVLGIVDDVRAGRATSEVLPLAFIVVGGVVATASFWIARRRGWDPPGRVDTTDVFAIGLAAVIALGTGLAYVAGRDTFVVVAWAALAAVLASLPLLSRLRTSQSA